MIKKIRTLYDQAVQIAEGLTDGWFVGLLARFVFAAVLFQYFWQSAMTKFDGGPFSISEGAYYQMVPESAIDAVDWDIAALPFHYDLMVYVGSYGEVILPLLIILGLFTRIAAVGMIIFTIVLSYVDVAVHEIEAGAWFDKASDAMVYDQRSFWIFLFLVLAFKGAGYVSIDHILKRFIPSNQY